MKSRHNKNQHQHCEMLPATSNHWDDLQLVETRWLWEFKECQGSTFWCEKIAVLAQFGSCGILGYVSAGKWYEQCWNHTKVQILHCLLNIESIVSTGRDELLTDVDRKTLFCDPCFVWAQWVQDLPLFVCEFSLEESLIPHRGRAATFESWDLQGYKLVGVRPCHAVMPGGTRSQGAKHSNHRNVETAMRMPWSQQELAKSGQ